jgi:FtsP/CotA-like multicopper oxidase with cupredoxin domain
MFRINRRQFLVLSGFAATTACLGDILGKKSSFAQTAPSVWKSENGLLEVNLEAKENPVLIGNKQVNLLTYNGQIPGPRLETQPGDKVRIHFTNNLSQPTNLHYHGLHIPPTDNGDNVFLHINPGETFTYEFEIGKNQKSQTCWYHPHLHGLTAEQLFGGLAGLFIIRGELDNIPEIKAAKEEFLVLQDFSADKIGNPPYSSHMSLMMGREGEIITVNGQINPTFSLPRNGLLRLRILNASTSRFYRLSLENHSLYQIAVDGHGLNEPKEVNELLLTPGQRADVLIKGDRDSGTYSLLNLPYDRGSLGMMGGGMMNTNNQDTPGVLATFNYESEGESLKLPTKLIPPSTLPEPQEVRHFELNHGMSPGIGMAFLINGEAYNGDVIQTQVKLNTIEDWEITNIGVMDHPFHLHINPFQIISRNGQPESLPIWRDTVLIPIGEKVRIRIAFSDFVGKTVYHCHILDHEDLGMMANLEIQA